MRHPLKFLPISRSLPNPQKGGRGGGVELLANSSVSWSKGDVLTAASTTTSIKNSTNLRFMVAPSLSVEWAQPRHLDGHCRAKTDFVQRTEKREGLPSAVLVR